MKDRQELIDKAKKQLDEFSGQLEELEKKMKDLSGKAKKVYDEQAGELRIMVSDAKEIFERAKNSNEETWEEIKGHVELTGKALRNSFNYFLSHYKRK